MNMNRVLFITPYYAPYIVGGAEISTQLIAEGLKEKACILTMGKRNSIKKQNEVLVCSSFDKKSYVLWKKVLDGEDTTLFEKAYGLLRAIFPRSGLVKEYKEIITSQNINIAVINSNIDILGRASVWKACKESGIKTVLVLRDPILLTKKIMGCDISLIYRNIIIRQLRWIDEIVAPSYYMIKKYEKAGIYRQINKVIPNAVDIGFQQMSKNKENVIIYAGSIREEKGILDLLQALQIVVKDGYNILLRIYGKGPLEEYCKKFSNVEVYGWTEREKLYNQINKAKLLILPSKYPEAFGRVLIESIAMGTLSLGSDSGGIPEIYEGKTEYVFTTGSAEDMSKKIERILDLSEDEYMRELLDIQALCEKYTYDKYISNWKEYLNIL